VPFPAAAQPWHACNASACPAAAAAVLAGARPVVVGPDCTTLSVPQAANPRISATVATATNVW
jgi:hypothetical protein